MELHASRLAQESVRRAVDEAKRLRHPSVRAEHLLLGVVAVPNGSASAALDALGIDRSAVRSRVEALLPAGSDAERESEYPYHPTGVAVLDNTMAEAREGRSKILTTARVPLGVLAMDDAPVLHALSAAGVSVPSLAARLRAYPDDPE